MTGKRILSKDEESIRDKIDLCADEMLDVFNNHMSISANLYSMQMIVQMTVSILATVESTLIGCFSKDNDKETLLYMANLINQCVNGTITGEIPKGMEYAREDRRKFRKDKSRPN
jgi:hypothetical protein